MRSAATSCRGAAGATVVHAWLAGAALAMVAVAASTTSAGDSTSLPQGARASALVIKGPPASASSGAHLPASAGSEPLPAGAPAWRRVANEQRSHGWRGAGVRGQELLPGETPEQCIARLRIPADERLEGLCRPSSALPPR